MENKSFGELKLEFNLLKQELEEKENELGNAKARQNIITCHHCQKVESVAKYHYGDADICKDCMFENIESITEIGSMVMSNECYNCSGRIEGDEYVIYGNERYCSNECVNYKYADMFLIE